MDSEGKSFRVLATHTNFKHLVLISCMEYEHVYLHLFPPHWQQTKKATRTTSHFIF